MTKRIGVLDSGLGGYSVFNALAHDIPQASFVFLADQLHAPYGDRTRESIYQCSSECIRWFENQGIESVIIACNTISSTCIEELKENFPTMSLYGIIDLTASQFIDYDINSIGVIATQATVSTHAYRNEIKKIRPHAQIKEVATPYLVPLIEGLAESEKIDAAIEEDMKSLNRETEILVLGCTHYPLIEEQLKKHYHHLIIDSRQPIVEYVLERMSFESGCNLCYTTGNEVHMKHQIDVLFAQDVDVKFTKL